MLRPKVASEFSRDSRAPLVRGDQAWCGSFWDEDDPDQQMSRPTYIVIGRYAPDDKLQKIAQRYGYDVGQLQAFRDGPCAIETEARHGQGNI